MLCEAEKSGTIARWMLREIFRTIPIDGEMMSRKMADCSGCSRNHQLENLLLTLFGNGSVARWILPWVPREPIDQLPNDIIAWGVINRGRGAVHSQLLATTNHTIVPEGGWSKPPNGRDKTVSIGG